MSIGSSTLVAAAARAGIDLFTFGKRDLDARRRWNL